MAVRSTLTLFGHSYCSLCAEMQQSLEALAVDLAFELTLVDIEGQPDLEARFGDFVPVLFCGEEKICHYHLDEAKLREVLAREPERRSG